MDDCSKCNTCKAAFSSIEKIKEHYKSDWHAFNSKRRANGLMFLRKEEFKTLNIKPRVSAIQKDQKLTSVVSNNILPVSEEIEISEQPKTEKILPTPKLGPNISIFDDKEFENIEDCVLYMSSTFGFFIPDAEYLSNLSGLLSYLGEKVKIGGYCLYCQKRMQPGAPVQHHMISKSHCKLAYENGVDGEEFEDFYDFSSSYEDLDEEDLEVDENGEIIEKTVEISHLGELVLPSGRTVGHRDFRIYYKQHYRAEESRPSVLALQREELLRLGYQARAGAGGGVTGEEVANMSDAEVMNRLVKYHKSVRRGMIMEQRARQKSDFMAMKMEYKSTKDKLRSSENTTAKIRDYHSRLM
jgi:pre-60S factor REI1